MSLYSTSQGITTPSGMVPFDNSRRLFAFGDAFSEIFPATSPFLYFLQKLRKDKVDDTTFKQLERRHQWQRRYFQITGNPASVTVASGAATISGVTVDCDYNVYGIVSNTLKYAPQFIVPGAVVAITTAAYTPNGGSPQTATIHFLVTGVSAGDGETAGTSTTLDLKVIAIDGSGISTSNNGDAIDLADNEECQIVGSAYAEATGAPDGWSDKMSLREGYTQIFKTAVPLMSGSAMATRYRGISSEWNRIWQTKSLEHKMDIGHAFMYGVGSNSNSVDGSEPSRFTHGILPYTIANGTYVSNFTYSASGFDSFVDFLKDYLAPEDGVGYENKLVLASRKIMAWMNKIGAGSLVDNSFAAGTAGVQAYAQVYPNMKDTLGFKCTRIETVFGDLNFYNETLLRKQYEDYLIIVDLSCVKYNYLAHNGISRDTFITTNIQNRDVDGRKDMILSEVGLQIDLPEKCAVIKFS